MSEMKDGGPAFPQAEGRHWSVEITHPQNACAYIKDADGNEMACLYGAGEGEKIGEVWHGQHKRDANARLIVTAVNEHAHLLRCVEALREARIYLSDTISAHHPIDDPEEIALLARIDSALSLLDEVRNGK